MEIAARIEEARRKAGLSQARLALAAGTQQNSVSRWEKGTHKPTITQAARIATACNVDLMWLITGAAASPQLTPDEQQIIDLIRALRLSKEEALRRIANPGVDLGPPVSPEFARSTGLANKEVG